MGLYFCWTLGEFSKEEGKCPLTSTDADPESCHWCHAKVYTDAGFSLGSQFCLMHPHWKLGDTWDCQTVFTTPTQKQMRPGLGDNSRQKPSEVHKERLVLSATQNMSGLLKNTKFFFRSSSVVMVRTSTARPHISEKAQRRDFPATVLSWWVKNSSVSTGSFRCILQHIKNYIIFTLITLKIVCNEFLLSFPNNSDDT